MKDKCDLCDKPQKYEIYRIKKKMWLNVCAPHDNFIGLENLKICGCSEKEAKKISYDVKHYED
jgi:hypothetical protein